MGTRVRKGLALVLVLAMMCLGLPCAAFGAVTAGDNQDVITNATHSAGTVSVSGKTIQVTVSAGTTVNAVTGLDFTYDGSVTSVATQPAIRWTNVTAAQTLTVGNQAKMEVAYYVGADGIEYTSTYTVSVAAKAAVAPGFSGNVSAYLLVGSSKTFTKEDFSGLYKQNDGGALSSVAITANSNAAGMSVSGLNIAATKAGTSTFHVDAYQTGSATAVGRASLTVKAVAAQLTAVDGGSVVQPAAKAIPKDNINNTFRTATGATAENLAYVQFTKPAKGNLYYDYQSATSPGTVVDYTANGKYYFSPGSGQSALAGVSYVSAGGTANQGAVAVSYKAYDKYGNAFTGVVNFNVTAGAQTVTYSVVQDEVLHFVVSDFNTAFKAVSGNKDLNYVQFTLPSSSYGTLYHDYSSVSNPGTASKASTKYYRSGSGNTLISDVTFVPKLTYNGTVNISFTGYDASGTSHTGTVQVTVTKSDSDIATISYTVDQDSILSFSASDFNSVFEDAQNENFSYVKFTLPSSSYGVLYVGYESSSNYDSKVASSDKYYRSSDPKLSSVDFVPKSSYKGTFTINYTAYNAGKESFTGKVQITVKDSGGDIDTLTYSIDQGEVLTFSSTDINREFKDAAGDETLGYVKFTLPSSSYGTLYYKYVSDSSYDSLVKANTKYYRSSKPELSDVQFVPKSGYVGTVTIDYTGYDSDDNAYSGKVKITVGDADSIADLSYSINSAQVQKLSAADLNTAFKKIDGDNFSYVKFTLPSAAQGTLVSDYVSAGNYGSLVTTTAKYYRSSTPYLDSVTFIPQSSFGGTAQIKYLAYNSDGDSYNGIVKINVTQAAVPANTAASAYFTDVTTSYSWAAAQIDYLYQKGVVKGISGNQYGPTQNISRGDFMLMLYRAFGLSATTSGNFSDVPVGSYYYDAIAVAKALNIAQGSGGKFNPNGRLTRQDAMVLIHRAMVVKGRNLAVGGDSDLVRFGDRTSISSYATAAVGTLVKAGVIDGYKDTTFKPQGLMTRAEMAVVLYRVDKL